MATERGKRKHVRFTLDVNFEGEVAKERFAEKLTVVRDLLTPRGAPKLDNSIYCSPSLMVLPPTVDCLPTPVRQRMLVGVGHSLSAGGLVLGLHVVLLAIYTLSS